MNQIELESETRAVLDRIRHSSKALSTYEMPADLAEVAVWEIGKVLVDNQHLPNVQYQTYRWFLREVSKLLRTRTGWDLALELEICMRKWQDYRLDPVLCQALVRECCERIASMTPEEVEEGQGSTTKTQRHEEDSGCHPDQAKRVEESRSEPEQARPLDFARGDREPTTAGAANG